ncbi:MAG: hypothetical protein J6I76_05915 [Oribacterium sp.]|nr:hypothetical protein [Oribacterium sp.]
MIDFKKYIIDGTVKRDRIVADIKRGRLTKEDILELDNNPQISDSYFGSGNLKKISETNWNNKYLDELSLVAVSEAFNKEYLLYLNEVATAVLVKNATKDRNMKSLKWVIIGILILILTICAIMIISSLKVKNVVLSIWSITLNNKSLLCLIRVLK